MFKERRSPFDTMYTNNNNEYVMYKVGQFIKLKKDDEYVMWEIINIDKSGLIEIRRVDDGHEEKVISRSLDWFILTGSLVIVDDYKPKKKIIRSGKELQEAIICPKCNLEADYYDKWFVDGELTVLVCECECGCKWKYKF